VGASTIGSADAILSEAQIRGHLAAAFGSEDLGGKRVCVVVPDATRHCPLPLLLDALHAAFGGRPAATTVVVALGTHPAMAPADLARLVGPQPAGVRVLNHEWWEPSAMVGLGELTAKDVEDVSEGRLAVEVPVRVNAHVGAADVVILVGPVLPHEGWGSPVATSTCSPGCRGPR
jgi:nickel-dependent lactate racemase